MTRSELIGTLHTQLDLPAETLDAAVRLLLDQLMTALADGQRIEVRGFGSFCLHERPARMGRNPKTGEAVALPPRQVAHFKPGKALRDRVNASRAAKLS